jgi:hypothetical protein
MICYCLVIFLAVVLRFYLQWVNAKRSEEEGFVGNAGAAGVVAAGKVSDIIDRKDVAETVTGIQLRPEDYEDVTDWKMVGFRYRL